MEERFGTGKERQGQRLPLAHLSPRQVRPHSSEVGQRRGEHTESAEVETCTLTYWLYWASYIGDFLSSN